jgi:hypothetical protein
MVVLLTIFGQPGAWGFACCKAQIICGNKNHLLSCLVESRQLRGLSRISSLQTNILVPMAMVGEFEWSSGKQGTT